jgi:hypothetical protein
MYLLVLVQKIEDPTYPELKEWLLAISSRHSTPIPILWVDVPRYYEDRRNNLQRSIALMPFNLFE